MITPAATKHIIIVEDDDQIFEHMDRALTEAMNSCNFELQVTRASCVREAVNLLKRVQNKELLCDILSCDMSFPVFKDSKQNDSYAGIDVLCYVFELLSLEDGTIPFPLIVYTSHEKQSVLNLLPKELVPYVTYHRKGLYDYHTAWLESVLSKL